MRKVLILVGFIAGLSPILVTLGSGKEFMTSEQVIALAKNELQLGSDAKKIESFLRQHKFEFSYDEFSERYQALLRVSKSHAIILYVFVGSKKEVIKLEVHDSFTGL